MYYDDIKERQVIIKTEDYQTEKVNEFVETLPAIVNYTRDNSKQYVAIKENGSTVNFTINTFNYIKLGLQGEYKDFFELTIDGTMYIVSPNEKVLRGFCGWINRLTTE
jgi:hypothetical protein